MTCKCYLLPGNADNQTIPGRKELILIFILGTDSDISPRIQAAGGRREGHFPPLHTPGANSVGTSGATVSRVGELLCVGKHTPAGLRSGCSCVLIHVGSEERTSRHNHYFCTHTTFAVLVNIHLLDSACSCVWRSRIVNAFTHTNVK